MFGRTPESRDFAIGLVATLAVVGGLFLYAKPSVDEPVAEVAEPQSMQPISATSQIDTSTIPVIATVYRVLKRQWSGAERPALWRRRADSRGSCTEPNGS
jgi:hypothetical protein